METDLSKGRFTPKIYNKFIQNALISEALNTYPGLSEVIAVRDQAEVMLTELMAQRNPGRKYDPYAFFVSGKIAGDWLDSMTAESAAKAAVDYKIGQVDELINGALAELDYRTEDAADTVLSYLNGKLAALLEPMKEAVKKLDGVDTPTDAIERDVTDAWKVFSDARGEYAQIREAQTLVMQSDRDRYDNRQSPRTDDRRANSAVISNLDEVWPEWSAPELAELDGKRTEAPWPTAADTFLLWSLRSGAVLWVPTSDELSENSNNRAKRIQSEIKRLNELDRTNPGAVKEEISTGKVHPAVQHAIMWT